MKILVMNRKQLLTGLGCLALAAVVLFAAVQGIGQSATVSAAKKKLPIYCVQKEEKIASLSFDAAWGNEDTQQLIDILGKYNVKATFFVVGEWVDKYPESVKALSDAGHEIMNHSATHPYMTKLSREKMKEEINACDDKIEAITGVRPILFRPPYGDYNDAVVEVLTEMNHYAIQWDVDSLDWKDLPAAEIQNRVLSKTKEGSIILFHNAAKHTPEALPSIIEGLQEKGFQLVPISEIIYKDNFTMDHEGRQIPNTGSSSSSASSDGNASSAASESSDSSQASSSSAA
ncbi:MAG: polysaccharide deacetylase family protein [Clostridiales bacterium]|nr:polysaccharide deacetylase family protein [Clostridiales bacterium]